MDLLHFLISRDQGNRDGIMSFYTIFLPLIEILSMHILWLKKRAGKPPPPKQKIIHAMGIFPNCHGIYSHRVNVGKNNADDLLINHVHFRASHVCGYCRILSNAFPGLRFDVRTLIPGPIDWSIDLEYVPPSCVIGLPRSPFWTVFWFGTFFIFPYIGKNNPNWLSYFSEGLKPPTTTIHTEVMWGHGTFKGLGRTPAAWEASQESINTQSLTTPRDDGNSTGFTSLVGYANRSIRAVSLWNLMILIVLWFLGVAMKDYTCCEMIMLAAKRQHLGWAPLNFYHLRQSCLHSATDLHYEQIWYDLTWLTVNKCIWNMTIPW